MNVLFWSETFTPTIGGAEVWGERFVDALRQRGHRVLVVTGTAPQHSHPWRDADAAGPIRRFPFDELLAERDGGRAFEIRADIAELKRTFQPDVVHLSSLGPSCFYHLVTREASPAPTLVTVHGWVRRLPTSGTLLRRILLEADEVVGVSHAVLRATSELVPIAGGRSSVIHHGIECPPANPEPLSVEPPTLMCLGRLVPEKGFDVAVEAMADLRRRIPGIRLVIVGDGREGPGLRCRVQELGLGDSVEFTGAVDPADVPAFLRRASIVVIPSRAEAFSLVALEAAAMGRPVIATHVGGLPEVVESEKTGVLVEPAQPAALVRAALRLLSDRSGLRAMGEAGRRRAELVFPWDACVAAYLGKYESLQRRLQPC
jgi:glycogen(starch) synthase